MPQLKILSMSSFEIFPFSCSHLKISGSCQESKYISTAKCFGNDLGIFSVNPPPVICAHITGGGLTENIPRSLPKHLAVEIYLDSWQLPEIFKWLQENGNISKDDMLRIFNCGIGMVLLVNEDISKNVKSEIKKYGFECFDIGRVIKKDNESVIYS